MNKEKSMSHFETILNDQCIIERYKQIEAFEALTGGSAHHNLQHVKNVVVLVEQLMNQLGCEKYFIEEAKIAAILHDVGALHGKENHATASYHFAVNYLKENAISLVHQEEVLEAIKIHSNGFESDNLMTLVLIISDKLDIKHTRLAKAGYSIKGMRQLQYIKDIEVMLDEKRLVVHFLCDEQLNREELESFYFIAKVFEAIRVFSEKIEVAYQVLINTEVWQFKPNKR